MMQITPVVKTLLIINFGVFLLGMFLNLDLSQTFGLRYFFTPEFAPYQIVTHIFLHGGFSHIFSNMLSLFFFGPLLEGYMGSRRFLIFYLICGFGASALYSGINYFEIYQLKDAVEMYLANPTPAEFTNFMSKYGGMFKPQYVFEITNKFEEYPHSSQLIAETKEVVSYLYQAKSQTVLIGASGAVFGILMAMGVLFPNLRLMLLFPPIPMKAKYFVLLYGAYEVYAEIIQKAGDNIAHTAHLGGMLFAYILIRYWGLRTVH